MKGTIGSFLISIAFAGGCTEENNMEPASPTPKDPNTATRVVVDRFSVTAGTLFIRDSTNILPGVNQPINFDVSPFVTTGLGPMGEVVQYYNFDVQSTTPAPIYVLFKEGEATPVAGQLNIIDVIPGDSAYNDFWQVTKVTVSTDYIANVVTSYAEIVSAGYQQEALSTIVNCPVVPESSTALLRFGGGSGGPAMGWYKGEIVFYFSFEESPLVVIGSTVPTSPIYVSFNINPNVPGGGPPSGFKTETGSSQTHNVVATLPGSAGYSPLWLVNIYDNTSFDSVIDLVTAQMAPLLGVNVATVNCPIVMVQ